MSAEVLIRYRVRPDALTEHLALLGDVEPPSLDDLDRAGAYAGSPSA